jgi:hypothetical protein
VLPCCRRNSTDGSRLYDLCQFRHEVAQIARNNVQLSNHPNFDEALEKIAKLKARTSWQPHPFGMGALAEARIFTVRVRARQSREAQVSR